MVDILIPIGTGSKNNNAELRLALRSIAKHTDVNRVFIITTAEIPWLQNVNIVKVGDPYTNNKDKNLINKVIKTLQQNPDIDDFVFWSDDQVITKDIKLADLPKVYNNRSLDFFNGLEKKSKWQRRLMDTLSILKLIKYDVSCNWEAHVPELYNSKKILEGIANIAWEGAAGNYTICTLFAYLCGYRKELGVNQEEVKNTYESFNPNVKFDKLYIGYNDTGFSSGVRKALFKHFKDTCKYESSSCDFDRSGTYVGALKRVSILAKNVNDNNIDKFCNDIKYDGDKVIFALDTASYKIIKDNALPVCYIPCKDNVDLITFTHALNVAKYLSNYCVVLDGDYAYPDNYIKDNLNNLSGDVSLCIVDTLQSFSTLLLKPINVLDIIEGIEDVPNIDSLGAFLIDKGVRPVVIVNNAT